MGWYFGSEARPFSLLRLSRKCNAVKGEMMMRDMKRVLCVIAITAGFISLPLSALAIGPAARDYTRELDLVYLRFADKEDIAGKQATKQEIKRFAGDGAIPDSAIVESPAAVRDCQMKHQDSVNAESPGYGQRIKLSRPSASPNQIAFPTNMLDMLILCASNSNDNLAVDPDLISTLTGADVPASIKPIDGIKAFASQLKPLGITVQKVRLTPQLEVTYLTTLSVWTYCTAIQRIETNDLRGALKILSGERTAGTALQSECATLRQNLEKVLEYDKSVADLEVETGISTRKMRALSGMRSVATTVATAGMKGGYGSANSSVATAKVYATYRDMIKLAEQMEDNMVSVATAVRDSNSDMGERFLKAFANDQLIESRMLLYSMITSFSRLKKTAESLRKAQTELVADRGRYGGYAGRYYVDGSSYYIGDSGIIQSIIGVSTIQPTLKAIQQNFVETSEASARFLKKAMEHVDSDPETALPDFGLAYALRPDSLFARAGAGYCMLFHHISSLSLLHPKKPLTPPDDRKSTLIANYQKMGRTGLLEILSPVSAGVIAVGQKAKNKNGAANGLAVYTGGGGGQLFPLSVRLLPREQKVLQRTTVTKDWWGNVVIEDLKVTYQDVPVSFGDYGSKDPYMWIAAQETLKWVQDRYGKELGARALKVEFRDLTIPKGGDSAGVTMAVCAYSSLKNVPIRQDVAMTGSIRSDGTVKAVGGVPIKLKGAMNSAGIQIIIVPQENEGDLGILGVDALCDPAIIVANNIDTYLGYSTDYSCRKDILAELRKGQVDLLLGNKEEAERSFRSVAEKCPEIYNARRLLALMQMHGSYPH